MRKYIWQELKRVAIKKKVALIIIFMIVIGFGMVNALSAKSLEVQLKQYKSTLSNLKTTRDSLKEEYRKVEFDNEIAQCEELIKNTQEQIDTINNYDKSKIEQQINLLEKENNPKSQYKIGQLKYEKEHNIEKGQLTPRGVYKGLEGIVFFSSFFMLIIIVLLSDIVSGEYLPNTIKLLITKPISRMKIIMVKFFVSIILTIATVVISGMVFILEAGVYLGFSDYKIPFDIGAVYTLDKTLPLTAQTSQMKLIPGSQKFIPLWIAVVMLVLITIIVLIAITAILLFISTICKNSLIAALANVILLGGPAAWYFIKFQGAYLISARYGTICKFFPIPYIVNSIEVLSGTISVRLTSSINMFFPLLVCLVWTSIMIFLSMYVFVKRNFD